MASRAPGSLRARTRRRRHPVVSLPGPLISVVMPTYESGRRYLREAIDSVRAQSHQAWELCIADDGSSRPEVRAEIERACAADPRVRAVYLGENQGIAAASNAALELAGGDYVAFLDHDDVLTADALGTVAAELLAEPDLDVVYSDQDKLDLYGRRADPFFKPDWSPVYALGAMYIGHLLVVRRSLAEEVGGFDSRFDKIQDFEFMLRVSERTERIHHIPEILYRWRAVPGSIAAGALEKSGVEELQAQAVTEHLARVGVDAIAVPDPEIPHRARIVAANGRPPAAASVIVAWDGREPGPQRLFASLARHAVAGPVAGAGPLEVIVIAPPGCQPPDSSGLEFELVEDPVAAVHSPRALNAGAARSDADLLVFLAATVEVTTDDWLEQLRVHALLPGVAAVGPLVTTPDGRAREAGWAIGLAEPAMAMLSGVPLGADGYYGALVCARDVSALGSRALAVSAEAFRRAGGFSEHFAVEYADFDLCQRLRSDGGRLVYAPRPRLIDHEPPARARARADVVDRALFVDRWYDRLAAGDPFYNPSFERTSARYEIAHDYMKWR
jgi:O-antigen biosynthesis protein